MHPASRPPRAAGPSALSRRRLLAGASAALAAPWAAASDGIGDSGKPVTLVVSYPAGGGADLIARIIAPRLSAALGGQGVVVENRPGASGQLAAGYVARAVPDGATLLVDASSYAVNPTLFPRLPYDIAKAFTPVAVLVQTPNVLVCTPGFEAKTVADVVRLAKARPGVVAYASSGNGSAQHLAGALFEQRAGIDMLHVPYRGGGPALNDVMAGQVPLFFANLASSFGHIQSGRLRPLAVTSRRRAPVLAAVPTMIEAGVPDYEVLEWNPLLAPAGVPAATRARLQAAVRQVLAEPAIVARVQGLSSQIFDNTPPDAAEKFILAQQAQWGRVIRERRITVD